MDVLPDPRLEAPQPPTGPGFSDAVTFAWGDLDREVFGLARVGLSPDGDGGAAQSSGLALLFSGVEPVAVRAAGGLPAAPGAGWGAIDAAGVRTTVREPLRSWDVTFTSDDGTSGYELRFEALTPPAALAPGSPAARAGGMEGYEQLCRVTGVARVAGERRAVSCLGQRGHSWGSPDWDRIALARTVSAWLGDDLGVTLTAIRPDGARHHADEAVGASVWATPDDGAAPLALPVAEARLSTTTDAEGRQRRAGIELYEHEEDPGHRAAGEVLCGTSLDLGRLR